MSRIAIPKAVLRQIGIRLSKKGVQHATRLLARHLRSDSRIWRQVYDHIARHFAADGGRAEAKLAHGVFDKAYRSFESMKKLLLEACQKPSHAPYFSDWGGKPRIIIEKAFTHPIGTAGAQQAPTNFLRIVIDFTGRPVSAFPIAKEVVGKAGGAAAALAIAVHLFSADGAYAATAVQNTYAEEADDYQRLYDNAIFQRTGGWAGEAIDIGLCMATLSILGCSSTAGGLLPENVAPRSAVMVRANEAVQRAEMRLGMTLDEETRQGIREDVLTIWRYGPPPDVGPELPPKAEAEPRLHVVRPGESLSKIALKYYNDMNDWGRIYAANYSQIGRNPNLLRVGTKLAIPG
jgi:nucleoid-associated protein YgaU